MRKSILLLLITVCILPSCRERQLKGAFQGAWYKQGFDTEAFSVRGDSIYYPGLSKGYYYDFKGDTLFIQFTERNTKSIILSFSSRRLSIWDMSLSQDTIVLLRRPGMSIDTIPN